MQIIKHLNKQQINELKTLGTLELLEEFEQFDDVIIREQITDLLSMNYDDLYTLLNHYKDIEHIYSQDTTKYKQLLEDDDLISSIIAKKVDEQLRQFAIFYQVPTEMRTFDDLIIKVYNDKLSISFNTKNAIYVEFNNLANPDIVSPVKNANRLIHLIYAYWDNILAMLKEVGVYNDINRLQKIHNDLMQLVPVIHKQIAAFSKLNISELKFERSINNTTTSIKANISTPTTYIIEHNRRNEKYFKRKFAIFKSCKSHNDYLFKLAEFVVKFKFKILF